MLCRTRRRRQNAPAFCRATWKRRACKIHDQPATIPVHQPNRPQWPNGISLRHGKQKSGDHRCHERWRTGRPWQGPSAAKSAPSRGAPRQPGRRRESRRACREAGIGAEGSRRTDPVPARGAVRRACCCGVFDVGIWRGDGDRQGGREPEAT